MKSVVRPGRTSPRPAAGWGAGAGSPQEQQHGCRDGAEEQGSGKADPVKDGVSPSPCPPGFHQLNNEGSEALLHLLAGSASQQGLAEEIRGGRAEGPSLTWLPERRGSAPPPPPETAPGVAVTPSPAAG